MSLDEPVPPDGDDIAAAFGLGRSLRELTFAGRGELGRIWRMDTDSGSFAVKELFLDDPGDGRDDVAFQRAMAMSGVPLPDPVLTPSGEVIRRLGTRWVRVYAWVDLDSEATVGDAVAGALLARIHLVAYPAASIEPWYLDGVGAARWDAVVAAGREAETAWAQPLAALVPELLTAERSIVLPAVASTPSSVLRCHLDFNPENVVVDARGCPVVLDWENSGGGVPEREVVMALWEFVTSGRDDLQARAAAFVAGYRDAGGRFHARDTSVFAMAFAVQAHLLEFFARRALDGQASDEDRARSDRWLTEMIALPLTPGAAEEIVAAVA